MSAVGETERVSILLVDDRPTNLMSLKALLQRPDYVLILARSGEEALSQVLRHELALILLDVAMPGMDGFQVASTIKERDQSKFIPIIFITASVYDMEHIFRGYTVGAVDYLRKPLDPQALRSKVAVFVELFRQRKQIERQAARLREVELREQNLLRARAEQALAESESLYQLTFEEAPLGIGHADAEGRITRVNRQLGEILGHDPADLIGRRIEELSVGEDEAALAHRMQRLRAGDTYYSGEHQLATRGGASIWVHLTLSALHDPGRAGASRFLVVANDITARKDAELERSRFVRELQHAIRARDDFLALVAHELKTPVTPLRLQVTGLLREAAKRGVIPQQKLQRRLGTMDRAVARLEALMERLLDVSRINLGAITLELADVDLTAVVGEVAKRVQYDAERTGSAIVVRADGPVVGRWDPVRLREIVHNLLANAIKYGAGKPIEVTISSDAEVAQLAVRDRGVGIPEEDQERIFERFERVAPLRHYGGFGLGLWIVRKIVEAHHGRVAVSSQPGRGSVFRVELPIHVSAEEERQARETAMSSREEAQP